MKSVFAAFIIILAAGGAISAPLPVIRTVLNLDFNSGALPVTTASVTAIGKILPDGTLTANTMSSGGDWNAYFETAPGLLKPATRYLLTLDYRVMDRDPSTGYFYMLTSSKTEQRKSPWLWKGYISWKGEKGCRARISKVIVLGPYDDYSLTLAIHGKAAIAVDGLTVQELGDIDLKSRGEAKLCEPEPYEPYGICFQSGMFWIYNDDDEVNMGLDRIRDAGFQWIRVGMGWSFMESEKGKIDPEKLRRLDISVYGALKRGIKPYIQILGVPLWASTNPQHERWWAMRPVDMNDFRRHVRFFAQRYHDRVKYWEIWNEQDWTFWESPLEEFVPLLKAAYEEIKRIDPECKVVLGGLATDGVHSWDNPQSEENALQRLYDAGAGRYFDILAVHPYASDLDTGITESIDKINTVWNVMRRNGDYRKRIWITEIGLSTWNDTLQNQAIYIRQVYDILTRHPAVDKIFWYNLRCIGEDPKDQEHNYGIVDFRFNARPAYDVFKTLPKSSVRRGVEAFAEIY